MKEQDVQSDADDAKRLTPADEAGMSRVRLALSFDAPPGAAPEILQAYFRGAPDMEAPLAELDERSARLKASLDEDPALARQFTKDPLTVLAELFPELELKRPADLPIEAERFQLMPLETAAASAGALTALRRALEHVVAAPAQAAAFSADPLGVLRQANSGQPAAEVAAAERALEQLLGIYRLDIERVPLEGWVYAANQRLAPSGVKQFIGE